LIFRPRFSTITIGGIGSWIYVKMCGFFK